MLRHLAEFLYDNWPASEANTTERKVWPRLYLWTKDAKLHVDGRGAGGTQPPDSWRLDNEKLRVLSGAPLDRRLGSLEHDLDATAPMSTSTNACGLVTSLGS